MFYIAYIFYSVKTFDVLIRTKKNRLYYYIMLDGFCVNPSEAGVGPALQHSGIPAVHISCFQKCLLLELISVMFKERHILAAQSSLSR